MSVSISAADGPGGDSSTALNERRVLRRSRASGMKATPKRGALLASGGGQDEWIVIARQYGVDARLRRAMATKLSTREPPALDCFVSLAMTMGLRWPRRMGFARA